MLKSVLDYLEQSESNFPQKKAVFDEKGSDTYSELADKARRVGTFLIKMGLKPNNVVVVFMGKERAALSAFWGVTYAGGIYCPLDCNAPVNRTKKIMSVLQPAFVLTDEEHRKKALEFSVPERLIILENALEQKAERTILEAIQRWRIDTDPLYIICTSGSTGVPKGVVISHRSVIDFTEESSMAMNFSSEEVFANQAPFYFDASVPDLYCTIRNGAALHIIPEDWFSFPIKVLKYINEKKVNAIFWVPSALILTANLKALGEIDVTCLKKIMFCGEVMPVKQYNMWKKYIPDAKYVNYYGPSETTYASTYYIIDRDFKNDESFPIGKAAINTGVLILNDSDELCDIGEIGELCIRGSGVALGYYNNPEKTKEVFVQNPLSPLFRDIMYRTGDLVKENSNGEIEYVGRRDFQIKHRGYRIELGEIEKAAMGVSGIQRVCSLYHEKRQKLILLYEGDLDGNDLQEALRKSVPDYMVPEELVRLESIPVNANGKIDRKYLKEKYVI